MDIRIKRLDKNLPLPRYESEGAAGIDLRCRKDVVIDSDSPSIVPTGIAIALEPGWEAQIRPRSGLSAMYGVTVVNSPGTIDSDYRGEIKVILQLLGNKDKEWDKPKELKLGKGSRIAQLVVKPAPQANIIEVEELDETIRGSEGFGSTGT
jgi:dUTP pyrophosphatase